MGKIKHRESSLKRDFIKYFAVCGICALVGSWLIGTMVNVLQLDYVLKYELFPSGGGIPQEKLDITSENMGYYAVYHVISLSQFIAIPLWTILCIVVCATHFYRKKLGKTIEILTQASEKISNNQLDFSVEAAERNELGKLCRSFEKMRAALLENNREMWRQMEERKRLNAAFAHDLRTPLTVLKGQSEMLVKYAGRMSGEKLVATAEMMERHITRLETYVNTMNDLQRLEDIEIRRDAVPAGELVEQLNVTAEAVCVEKGRKLLFHDGLQGMSDVMIDLPNVMQVYENLLANAVRYARSAVTVEAGMQEDFFIITVADDGPGFSAEGLVKGAEPFYRSEKENWGEHLGIGLNICNIICERHGGSLKLTNDNGARVMAAFRCSGLLQQDS